jgi:hypothetical protein
MFSVTIFLFSRSTPINSTILGSKTKQSKEIMVSASIGDRRFTLFGYSSPYAFVTLEGTGIFDQTYADSDGYFEFRNRFSPFSPREACLTAQDQLGRLSNPICLPAFPTSYNITIGPVILPPTISLANPSADRDYFIGDEIVLAGQTIPNSEVDLSMFIDENKSLVNYLASEIVLIKPAYALTFPKLTTGSDDEGNFAVSLPSSNPDFIRLFTQVNFQNELSPKSIALNIKVFPIWMIIIKLLLLILEMIRPRLLEIIILAQIGALLVYFLRRYLKPHVIAKNKAMVLRENFALVK